jgi:beta-mannosidase
MKHPLSQSWTLSFTHPVTQAPTILSATVPGNVEIDLMAAGLIDDPYPPDRPDALLPFEWVNDWTYRTTFDGVAVTPGQTIHLVFEGIDTIADVFLNGQKLLGCENMLIPHEAEVTGLLKPQGNSLEVVIASTELYARQFPYVPHQISREHRVSQGYLRKARHMWGWDNAPRLVSAGLWRPVYLETRNAIRVEEVYTFTQKVQEGVAHVGINWRIRTPDLDLRPYKGKLSLSSGGVVELERNFEVEFIAGRILFPVKNPKLWWPYGYGEPHLYDLKIEIFRDTECVAQWESKFGIREIELIRTETTTPAGDGEFLFRCNGEKIYANGTNWKSLDALLSCAEAKVEKALDLCRDLNCNMVRVWGGGIYEDHAFFDYCDRHGLLVWQDFMFGCEWPPRDNWFQKAVAVEAASVIRRYRNHASLAVWCGDNENDMTVFWGLFQPPSVLPSMNVITRKVLKQAVEDLDPYRPYYESSPYISDTLAKDRWAGNANGSGDRMIEGAPEQHIYAPGGDFFALYRQSAAHFVSETGPFFINSMSHTREIVERELPRAKRLWDLDPAKGPEYTEYHQWDGYFMLWKETSKKHLREHFHREFSPDDWEELAVGINSVTGILFKFCIEYARIRKWRKTGVLWWSLLDMWPMMFNYSVVDSAFRKKQPAYGWIKQSHQTTCLAAEFEDDGKNVAIYALNDSRNTYAARCKVSRVGDDGALKELAMHDFTCAANVTSPVITIPASDRQELWILELSFDGKTVLNHFVSGTTPFDFGQFRRWILILDGLYGNSTGA